MSQVSKIIAVFGKKDSQGKKPKNVLRNSNVKQAQPQPLGWYQSACIMIIHITIHHLILLLCLAVSIT